MKNYCTLLLFLLIFNMASGQYWMQCGGSATIDEAMDIAVDGNNNTYTTGYFTSTATIDGNSITAAGLDDIFIVKTNSAGVINWMKSAGGFNTDKTLAIAADASGNTVITGFFYATADFDGQSITSSGQQDIFVAKYNTSGTIQWAIKAGGAGSDVGNGITFDNAGNVIVTGEFSGTCTFGSTTLTSMANSLDVFTAKYDANGNLLWVKQGSGLYTDRGTGVATDAGGSIYVSGMFSDTVTFDNTYNNSMYNAMFLIKYDGNGQEQWFRWMGSGSVVGMGDIAIHGNDINLTGNFNGAIYFFGGSVHPTLTGTQPNDIFVIRYDTQGTPIWWHADGSTSEVTANSISAKNNGEVVVGGNFKCRFTDMSARYGDGIFCSVGFWDTYVSSYDNSGNWLWARQYAGKQDDYLHGTAMYSNDFLVTCGSFSSRFICPFVNSSFTLYGTNHSYLYSSSPSYCSDINYSDFISFNSAGNSDIFINANIDLTREPYDFFDRSGTNCDRPFNDICIGSSTQCPDTVEVCGNGSLSVNLNSSTSVGPDYNYLWSNGSTSGSISSSTSGYYSVVVTSDDGCFTNEDTVYLVSNPIPPRPLISDSKGINTGASSPLPIPLCLPDSVILTCTNVGTNTVQWTTFPAGVNPITVFTGGSYHVTLTNQYGCHNSNVVSVVTGNALPNVQAQMLCPQDSDRNDTIELCFGQSFKMFVYDELSNPSGNILNCFPEMTSVMWSSTNSANVGFSPSTNCAPYSWNNFVPSQVGDFDFLISAWVYRENPCDSDSIPASRNIHVIVNPVPSGTVTITISGPTNICYGDTIMLVASSTLNTYQWSTGDTTDTVYITAPGSYSVHSTEVLTNSFGCSATVTGNDYVYIALYPQPTVTMIPANGLICPNDSVELTCSGTGTFNWQGPNGNVSSTSNIIYVNVPGFYYSIETVAPGCELVSNTVEVIQYNVPLIVATPYAAICGNDSVMLNVMTNPGSTIQWQSPLSGSSTIQVVHSPGTYNCIVTSCGIVTPLSLTVAADSALAQISASNTSLTFCSGDSIHLYANSGMAGYTWFPTGDTLPSIVADTGGTYSLFTTSTYGCRDTATITLTEIQNTLTPPSTTDTALCLGDPVTLVVSGSDTIHWSDSHSYSGVFLTGTTLQIPQFTAPVTYYLFTQSGICRSTFDSVSVTIGDFCDTIIIPNVMTPNGDGLNDIFPGSKGLYTFDLKVYNRWGNLVYDGSGLSNGWKGENNAGTPLSGGTYYFIIYVHFFDAHTQHQKGFLEIIRE